MNEEVWAWEPPIFAPAAGTVVDVVKNVPDNNVPGIADPSTPGNVIALQTAPQEFLVMGHLRHDSVAVTLGEEVQAGQFLGRVGNSGFSFGPHLHMQLMDRPPYPYDPEAISLPFHFKDLLVNGQPKANPVLVKGDFVQHAGCPIPVPAEFAAPSKRDRRNRRARGSSEPPAITRRNAEEFRSPAAIPVDGVPPMPWGNRRRQLSTHASLACVDAWISA